MRVKRLFNVPNAFMAQYIASRFVCFSLLMLAPIAEVNAERDQVSLRTSLIKQIERTGPADFGIIVGNAAGPRFEYYKGKVGQATQLRYWSATKLVSAAVIMDLVEKGVLDLADHPGKYIKLWKARALNKIRLDHLLSFTSGLRPTLTKLIPPQICHQRPNKDFFECAFDIYRVNRLPTHQPGKTYKYGGTHMHIAGLMAIRATGASTWHNVFERFSREKNLFPGARYSTYSTRNPLIAGGLVGTTRELASFAQRFFTGQVVKKNTMRMMFSDYTPPGSVKIISSPAVKQMGEDWHYGLGVWHECRAKVWRDECGRTPIMASLGHGGTYLWIDRKNQYWGVIGRDDLSVRYPAPLSVNLMRSVEPLLISIAQG